MLKAEIIKSKDLKKIFNQEDNDKEKVNVIKHKNENIDRGKKKNGTNKHIKIERVNIIMFERVNIDRQKE